MTNKKQQIIDGFGAHQGNEEANQEWWLDLYYNDMRASIYRVDLTPKLVSPYADFSYYSPWFLDESNHPLDIKNPNSVGGPDSNRVRTYTNADDYGADFAGYTAPIAVMGPDIAKNVQSFSYSTIGAITQGLAKSDELGGFKLIASVWSPVPWVKVSSGNNYPANWWPGPVKDSPWPFIWGGNFAGGRLDVSNEPLDIFDDSALGGEGSTSALTQFSRSMAAYIKGYQNFHHVQFYAISIQNELNFEQFYNSATYPLSTQYIIALKAIRAEFDKYPDLKDIKIMGPEDVLGGDIYGMYQYGSGNNITHKNLQYLSNIALNSEASEALDFFCIHGYHNDGASASGTTPVLWDWWVNGWEESPVSGIPNNVKGFTFYNKKSWMTETSGENYNWLHPSNEYPNEGAWSLALRMHQALTAGRQSAWLYWTFSQKNDDGTVHNFGLTTQAEGGNSPKYVAAKHFFRYIRPNAYRVSCNTSGDGNILGSAYTHEADSTLTVVIINTLSTNQTVDINLKGLKNGNINFDSYTSSDGKFWQSSTLNTADGSASITLPGYSVTTLYGTNALVAKE